MPTGASPPPGRQTAGPVPRPAAVYGGAGLIPFVAGALALWWPDNPYAGFALALQLQYAAVILSFLGAVHWGLALTGAGTGGDVRAACSWERLGWSVAPALVGWAALVMTPVPGLIALILAFAAAFFADLRAVRNGLLPAWYPRLRRPLTAVVVACLGASLMRVLWG